MLEDEVLYTIKKEKKEEERRQKELEAQKLRAKEEARRIEDERRREKEKGAKKNEVATIDEEIEKNENDESVSSSSDDSIFDRGYFPIGMGMGFSKTPAPLFFNMGFDVAYLFYTEYIDVGPEIKFSFSPIVNSIANIGGPTVQVDFGFAAKVQKKVYEGLYVAADAGFDFFNVKPHIAAFIGGESRLICSGIF